MNVILPTPLMFLPFPLFTALFSGKRGIKTGVVSFNPNEVLPEYLTWVPRTVAQKGHVTAAVSTLYHMRKWYAMGYHYYMDPVAGAPQRLQTVEAEEINSMAIPWIGQNYRKDFFLFIHYWDPHEESVRGEKVPAPMYKVPEGYKDLYYKDQASDPYDQKYLISQYDANITSADKYIGELLQTLDEVGIAEKTTIVFTSDHGEDLGEQHPGITMGWGGSIPTGVGGEPPFKGVWDHPDVYEPVIRVPLIIKTPEKGAHKVRGLVQNVDISATVLDLLGIRIPPDLDGKSLLPSIRREVEEGYSEVYSNSGLWTAKRTIVTKEGIKLIKTLDKGAWKNVPEVELYDLNKDPDETYNLAEEDKETADQLELKMEKWLMKNLGRKVDPLAIRAAFGFFGGQATPYYTHIYAHRMSP